MAGNFIAKANARMEAKGTKGAFTKQAKAAGMSVQGYANKVTAKGSKASTTTKKRAAFAKAMNTISKGK